MQNLGLISHCFECTNISDHVEPLIVLCCSVGCHGNLVFSNLLPGNDSFVAIPCIGNVISEPLLSNVRLSRLHHSGLQPSCHSVLTKYIFMYIRIYKVWYYLEKVTSSVFKLVREATVLWNIQVLSKRDMYLEQDTFYSSL
jgi:hypothetical protein